MCKLKDLQEKEQLFRRRMEVLEKENQQLRIDNSILIRSGEMVEGVHELMKENSKKIRENEKERDKAKEEATQAFLDALDVKYPKNKKEKMLLTKVRDGLDLLARDMKKQIQMNIDKKKKC